MEQQRKEINKKQLLRAIEQGLPIGEEKKYSKLGEQIDSDFYFNPKPRTWEDYDDIYTIPITEIEKVKEYTTLTKSEKDNQVFGKFRCRAYSNKLEREINKNFIFYVKSFTYMYGIGNDMKQVRKPNRRISFLEDAPEDEIKIEDEPELGGFILVRGKEVF